MERFVECLPFASEGRQFLFVVPTSAVFEVDPEVAALVASARDRPSDLGKAPADLLATMRHLGLVEDPEHPLPRLADPIPLDGPLSTLVLHLGHGCAIDCAYCYGRPRGGEPDGEAPALMSPRIARAAVDFLFDQPGGAGPLGLTFFGGEPLLNLPALQAAGERAQQRAAETGRSVRYAVTTSGVPLTDEAVSLLRQLQVQVTVSLDGPREVHDAHRRHRDGRGSYDEVAAAVGRLVEHTAVHGRATLTRLHPDPVPVVDHLRSLGMVSAGVSTADVPEGPLALDPPAYDRLAQGMEQLADRALGEARRGRRLGFSNLDGLLRSLHRGLNRDLPCGAGVRLAACDTDGTLSLCHRLTGEPRHVLGDITRGLRADRPDRLRALTLSNRPGCGACWARYLCGGGCHHAREVEAPGGAAQPAACDWLRRWLHKGLEVYGVLAAEAPGYLEEFVDPAPPCAVE